MTTTTQTAPVRPADLDTTKLHSPATVAKWKEDNASYFAALRAIDHEKEVAAARAEAERTRPMTQLEYWNMAQAREAEKQAKAREAEKAEKAAARAEIDRLASSPAVAEIMHRNEFLFIREIAMWCNRGYKFDDNNSLLHSGNGLYHAQLFAPAPAVKGGAK